MRLVTPQASPLPHQTPRAHRASRPNQYRHLDATVIKLLDGTRTPCQLLAGAAKHLPAGNDATSVVADSGVENVNEKVYAWFDVGPLRRVLAQVEISFSCSRIEAWWRSLKNGWLYLCQPDTSRPW